MASTTHIQFDSLQHGPPPVPHTLSWPVRLVVILASVKCAIALSTYTPLGPPPPERITAASVVMTLLPALVASILMFLTHSRHNRTNFVGVALLLIAVRPTATYVRHLAETNILFWPLSYGPVNVFFPYFVGRSLMEFPRARNHRAAQALRWVVTGALAFAWVRFVCGALLLAVPAAQLPWTVRLINGDIYQSLGDLLLASQIAIITGAGLMGLSRLLPQDEQRQRRIAYAWTTYGVACAYYAVMLIIKWPEFPGNPRPVWRIITDLSFGWINLLLPASVAYAVLRGQTPQWRAGLRRVALAVTKANVLAAAAGVPFVCVLVHVWNNRSSPVDQVFAQPVVPWLIVSAVAGWMLARREQLRRAINRRLFSDHYDPSETAFAIATAMRNSQSVDELAAHLTSGIDRALRPYRVVVLALDASGRQFVPLLGTGEALPASSVIAEIAAAGPGVIDTTLANANSPMRWLPQEERYWLADCGARLVVPMRSATHRLIGLIALSDRQNGRDYGADDRQWLISVAGAATMTLEARLSVLDAAAENTEHQQPWHVGAVARHTAAGECQSCGRVTPREGTGCADCGGACVSAPVPLTLLGKFQFERRIGKGGMGVVYRALDLALDRPVAVKMLPGTTPENAERLRHEARAMAAVTHRHLAVVYGVEAWRGQPLLFCEFMEHGTLADRLKTGSMSPRDALAIGVAIAEATQALHDRQLLHRDIKPSNIGFDRTGVPKLLDFGLAHLTVTEGRDRTADIVTAAGTPLYMSPETLSGHSPTPGVDIWSLHVLLYEILAGQHPFRRGSSDETIHAVVNDAAPPLVLRDAAHSTLGGRLQFYFGSALHKDPARRPRTAADVATALRTMGQ